MLGSCASVLSIRLDTRPRAPTMRLAGSHTSTNSYDGLNRLTGATYADSTTATLTYDTGTYGIGHLTELQDVAGTTNWTYDQHGRPTQMQQTTTGSISLTVSYSYDAYGRPDTITYPSGRAITRSYDADGRVTKLAESTATVKGELGASVPDRVLCVSARSQALRKLRACLRPAVPPKVRSERTLTSSGTSFRVGMLFMLREARQGV